MSRRANNYPWPGESPVQRARRVAQHYRQKLYALDPTAGQLSDADVAAVGETWAIPTITVALDGWLTPAQAGELANLHPDTIGALRRRGRLAGTRTDAGWRYKTDDILQLLQTRRRGARPTDRITADGTRVPETGVT